MINKTLYFIITFDVCSDFDVMENAILRIKDNISIIQKKFGRKINLTWFIRCDNQIKSIFNDNAYLVLKNEKLLSELQKNGDEIGWHPHIYRKKNNMWCLETRDDILKKKLQDSFNSISHFFKIKSVRMGESYQSNESMKLLNDLGLQVDSTALPGRKRNDTDRFFDWIDTPHHPYYPSMIDYRVPGSDSLNILEVPMSTIPIKTEYDSISLDRYINLSFYNDLMRDNFESILKRNDFIVTITHPFEIIPINSSKHGLLSFDIGEFQKNFINMLEICERIKRPYKFITMSEVPKIWNGYK